MMFYPHQEDLVSSNNHADRLDVLLEAAQRYKAIVLDAAGDQKVRTTPREIDHVFNWDEVAKLLRELRELPEGTTSAKAVKAERLTKLAEVYEVLRAAKMPKLEAVRLALMNEVGQLKGNTAA